MKRAPPPARRTRRGKAQAQAQAQAGHVPAPVVRITGARVTAPLRVYDAVVIGGSLAGCILAILLAHRGLTVALLDTRRSSHCASICRQIGQLDPALQIPQARPVDWFAQTTAVNVWHGADDLWRVDVNWPHGIRIICGRTVIAADGRRSQVAAWIDNPLASIDALRDTIGATTHASHFAMALPGRWAVPTDVASVGSPALAVHSRPGCGNDFAFESARLFDAAVGPALLSGRAEALGQALDTYAQKVTASPSRHAARWPTSVTPPMPRPINGSRPSLNSLSLRDCDAVSTQSARSMVHLHERYRFRRRATGRAARTASP
jgi:flavin-dependent dehydrogenase